MSQPPRPGHANPAAQRSGTLIESEEDVWQALLSWGLTGVSAGRKWNPSGYLHPTM